MQALFRSLPGLCALIIALCAVLFFGAALVGVSYHPQSPHAHLIFPYLIGSTLAAGLAIVFLASSVVAKRKTWRQTLRTMLVGTGVFLLAGVVLPFVYRVPDEIIVTYRYQDYAIPRIWNPAASRAGTYLSVEVCLNSLEPRYASLDCSRVGSFVVTTEPILRASYAGFALDAAKATHDGDRILSRGDLLQSSDATLESVSGWRNVSFQVDQNGAVQEFRSCGKGEVYANAPCDVGVRSGMGTILIHLPPDRSASVEAEAFLGRLEGWRCPGAAGC